MPSPLSVLSSAGLTVDPDQSCRDHAVTSFLHFLEEGHDARRSYHPGCDHCGIHRVRRNARVVFALTTAQPPDSGFASCSERSPELTPPATGASPTTYARHANRPARRIEGLAAIRVKRS